MSETNQLALVDGIGVFKPTGSFRFQQAIALVTAVIVKAREQGLRKILIDSRGLSGFQPPSLSERHWMVREWVEASGGRLKIAVVAPEAFIDPEKFGIVAAANFGVTSEVFTSELEAMQWLHGVE